MSELDLENETTTSNNPFAGFNRQTESGRNQNNFDNSNAQETTGELVQDTQNTADQGNSQYNPGEPGGGYNPNGDGEDVDPGSSFVDPKTDSNTTPSGVDNVIAQWMNGGIIAIGATVALAAAVVIGYYAKKGFTQSKRTIKAETKINTNSTKFYTAKKLQRQLVKLDKSVDQSKIEKAQRNIEKLQAKIAENQMSKIKAAKQKKYFAKQGIYNIATKKKYLKANIISKDYDRKLMQNHLKGMKYLAKAEIAGYSKQQKGKNANKTINKYLTKADENLNKVNFGNIAKGLHFPDTGFKSKEGTPLYIHRAITDTPYLTSVIEKAHSVFPYADKNVETCTINLKSSKDPSTNIVLQCSFDNKVGYKVCKAALLTQIITEMSDEKNSDLDLDIIEIHENATKSKSDLSDVYDLSGKYGEEETAKNIQELSQLIDKSNKYLDEFNKKFSTPKTKIDLEM